MFALALHPSAIYWPIAICNGLNVFYLNVPFSDCLSFYSLILPSLSVLTNRYGICGSGQEPTEVQYTAAGSLPGRIAITLISSWRFGFPASTGNNQKNELPAMWHIQDTHRHWN